jgi:hypothetical protein
MSLLERWVENLMDARGWSYDKAKTYVEKETRKVEEPPKTSRLILPSTGPGACPVCNVDGDCEHRAWVNSMIDPRK